MSELTSSARKALFVLKKYFVKNPEIQLSLQIQLFNIIVAPIVNYGCEIWGSRKADPIEKFHRSFLKYVLRVKSSTPNCFVYGELGVYPLYIERYIRIMSFWVKIINCSDKENSLLYRVYKELCNLTISNPREVTWASRVMGIPNKCGLGNIWVAQNIYSKTEF